MDFFFKLLDLDMAIKNEQFNLVKEYIEYLNADQIKLQEIEDDFKTLFITYFQPGFIDTKNKLEIIKYIINNFNLILEKEYFLLVFTFEYMSSYATNEELKNWLLNNGKQLLVLSKQSVFNKELNYNINKRILLTCRMREFYDLMNEFRNIIQGG